MRGIRPSLPSGAVGGCGGGGVVCGGAGIIGKVDTSIISTVGEDRAYQFVPKNVVTPWAPTAIRGGAPFTYRSTDLRRYDTI